jgi:cytoskeletal protein CcmA (bactofilin family)
VTLAWFDQAGGEWTGFLDQGVKLDGKLEANGLFRIDTEMKGKIVSKETLILGEHAVVEGEIEGSHVAVAGRFEGTIKATNRVEVQPKAIVKGEIYSSCVVFEPGAVFDGQCHMRAGADGGIAVSVPVRSAMGELGDVPRG